VGRLDSLVATVERSWLPLLLVASLWAACGLTVTKESPSYHELDAREKQAVDIILGELTALDKQVRARTPNDISPLTDRENIDVSFEAMIFVANIGDGQVHVSTWENLTDQQRALVQTWFKASTLGDAQKIYEKLFYQFLAVSQGVKQFMYNALTTAWVFERRSLFNVERDSIRTTLAYYQAVGRRTEMWTFLTNACMPVISQYGALYGAHFDKVYLQEHFTELADGKAPTGYMYFLCRWILWGKDEADDLTEELNWLRALRTL
jgi:hypothetical protein